MEVILLEKIANLGNLGDKASVRPGYGRNFLLPKGKAVSATASKIAEFEARRAELEQAAAEKLLAAQTRAEVLNNLSVTVTHKAGDEGKLFGSVGTQNIADALTEAGAKVEKHEVRLPEGAIRQVGDYEVDIDLHSDVIAIVKLTVAAE